MISGANIGFIVLFLMIGVISTSVFAAAVIIRNKDRYGFRAGLGLGVIAFMLAVPLIILVGRVATAIY